MQLPKLRKEVKKKGPANVARTLGVSRQTVWSWLAGDSSPQGLSIIALKEWGLL